MWQNNIFCMQLQQLRLFYILEVLILLIAGVKLRTGSLPAALVSQESPLAFASYGGGTAANDLFTRV